MLAATLGCVQHSALSAVTGNLTEHHSSQQRTGALCGESDLGEREAGGRQPRGGTGVKGPGVGSALRCVLAPTCQPRAVSLTGSLPAWSSQGEAGTSTWRAGNQEKQGLVILSAMEGIFREGLRLLHGSRSLCRHRFYPVASRRVPGTCQVGLLLIFCPCCPSSPRGCLVLPCWPSWFFLHLRNQFSVFISFEIPRVVSAF